MAYAGYGKNPPLKAIQQLAAHANLSWPQAKQVIAQVREAMGQWATIAGLLDVSAHTSQMIEQTFDRVATENRALYASP